MVAPKTRWNDPTSRRYLRSALLQTEGIEHFSGALESDPLTLLPDCECGEEDGRQPVLSPGQPVARVTSDLEQKLSVPALMEQTPLSRTPHRKTAEDEGPG